MSATTTQVKQLRAATFASVLDCLHALEAHDGNFDKALEQLRAIGLDKADQQAHRETREGLVVVKRSDLGVCAIQLNCETDFVALTQEFKSLAQRIADQVLYDVTLTDVDSTLAANFTSTPGQTVARTIKELAGQLGENMTLSQVARYEVRDTRVVEGYVHAGAIESYGPTEGRLGVLVELETGQAADVTSLHELAHNLALQIASAAPVYVSRDAIPTAELQSQRQSFAAQAEPGNKPEAIKAKIVEGRLNKFFQQVCLLDQPYIKDDSIKVEELLRKTAEVLGTPIRVVRFARFELDA